VLQLAGEPPPVEPEQFHFQGSERGPEPETAEAAPELQRLLAGFVLVNKLFAEPQAP
jgi:hypothetical protein